MSTSNQPQLPTSIEDLLAGLRRINPEEGLRRAAAFEPQATDIFIVTYPKSGTTWLQQIVHGLRTQGSMDFDNISEVIPFFEMALDFGTDLQAPQPGHPRAFKTHLPWAMLPKGARYIYVLRNPKDVLISHYHFLAGWRFEPGTVSLEDFANEIFMFKGRLYERHFIPWWERRHQPDTLLLCYEDLQEDLPKAVQRIAPFIGCPLDEELLATVVEQSSFAFMQAHKHKFAVHSYARDLDQKYGLPTPDEIPPIVRTGRVGNHVEELPAVISQKLDMIWQEEVGSRFGFRSYQALREALANMY